MLILLWNVHKEELWSVLRNVKDDETNTDQSSSSRNRTHCHRLRHPPGAPPRSYLPPSPPRRLLSWVLKNLSSPCFLYSFPTYELIPKWRIVWAMPIFELLNCKSLYYTRIYTRNIQTCFSSSTFRCFWDPSLSMYEPEVRSFSLLHSLPLCSSTTARQALDIWGVSRIWDSRTAFCRHSLIRV